MKVTLYTYLYVNNNHGIWSRHWELTAEAAEKVRKETIENLGVHKYVKDESVGTDSGEYGDVSAVKAVEVELTPQGVLAFAQNYAFGA